MDTLAKLFGGTTGTPADPAAANGYSTAPRTHLGRLAWFVLRSELVVMASIGSACGPRVRNWVSEVAKSVTADMFKDWIEGRFGM